MRLDRQRCECAKASANAGADLQEIAAFPSDVSLVFFRVPPSVFVCGFVV